MTSKFVKRALVIGFTGMVAIIVLYSVGFVDRCPLKQLDVVNDLKKYQKTNNAELCEDLVVRIVKLNQECKTDLAVIDCG